MNNLTKHVTSLELSKREPIRGYEGLYEIDEVGSVYSLSRNKIDGRKIKQRILKQSLSSTGYYTVTLYKGGSLKRWCIHRLLGLTFLPNIDNSPCINHKNGVKSDNRLDNLEWCDYSYNIKDSFNRGRVIWNKGLMGRQTWHNTSGLSKGTPWNKGRKLTKEERKDFRDKYRKTREITGNHPFVSI